MSATISVPDAARWLPRLLSGRPHQVIVNRDGGPYLRRWYLIAQNARPNIYLHHFMRSDDDRAFHDHPWSFASLVLRGSYLELTENSGWTMRRPGSITLRRAEHRHRIVLPRNPDETERPCWTLVVTGSRRRQWAFWCGHRFVPWQAFGAGGCDTPSVTS